MSAMYSPNVIFMGPPNNIKGASIRTHITNVITSYSIHYTKLYETSDAAGSGQDSGAGGGGLGGPYGGSGPEGGYAAGGGYSTGGGMGGAGGGRDIPANTAKYPPPKDIPSGDDDDVVARQLREAAMREPDPAVP